MITRESLETMFQNIRTNTDWDTHGKMLWGYFFTHSEPSLLNDAAAKLSDLGYKVVDIYLSDKDGEEEADLWWLHTEKIEQQDVE